MKNRYLSFLLASLLGSCQLIVERFGPDRCEGELSSCDGNILQTCVDGFIKNTDCQERACLEEFGSCDLCNDGAINAELGEECDDGNNAAGDGCDAACAVEAGFECTGAPSVCASSCGDNTLDAGEECDDGNNGAGDGCDAACQDELCGDVVVNNNPDLNNPNEECDDGNALNGDGCSDQCKTEFCGDNVLNNGNESCDDGNLDTTDACPSGPTGTCQNAFCGDTFTQTGVDACDDGEHCTDGTACTQDTDCAGIGDALCLARSGDGCSDLCVVEFCGDAVPNNNEGCDDGEQCDNGTPCANDIDCGGGLCAPRDGDGCRADCTVEACGDNIIDAQELCDGGTDALGNPCRADCQNFIFCGNLLLDGTEECDDGAALDGDGCSALCAIEFCGDAAVNNTIDLNNDGDTADLGEVELCDGGADALGNPCRADCQNFAFCGNGLSDGAEQCDNGKQCSDLLTPCLLDSDCALIGDETCAPRNGDGCTFDCLLEQCGDGIVGQGETCDDGSGSPDPGCTLCQIEDGFACNTSVIPSVCVLACGNGVLDPNELCDDNNTTNGDGCDSNCLPTCDNLAVTFQASAKAVDETTGHCYLLSSAPNNGTSAKTACEALNTGTSFVGHLATITSADENFFVRQLRFNVPLWIGLTDSSEGAFRWVTGERLNRFINFSAGEPNNGGGGSGQDCTQILPNRLTWDDDVCTLNKPFVCEFDFGKQCGNGILEAGETCDDGNQINNDPCRNNCTFNACNNTTTGGNNTSTNNFSNSCFAFYNTQRTWQQAQDDCTARGGFLATASTNSAAITDELATIEPFTQNEFWIGLNDLDIEGFFQWVNQESLEYTDFEDGEPNGGTGENCMEVNGDNQWNDLVCGTQRPYVCEF